MQTWTVRTLVISLFLASTAQADDTFFGKVVSIADGDSVSPGILYSLIGSADRGRLVETWVGRVSYYRKGEPYELTNVHSTD